MASSGTCGTGPCVPEGNGGGGILFFLLCVRCGVWVSARTAIGRASTPTSINPVSFRLKRMTTPISNRRNSGDRKVLTAILAPPEQAMGLSAPSHHHPYLIERIDFIVPVKQFKNVTLR